MKTHGEVQAAIDAGKQLQGAVDETDYRPSGFEDITHEQANEYSPCDLRIKPGPPKRLECWSHNKPNCAVWSVYDRPFGSDVRLREVRPGDLTREEIDERLGRVCRAISVMEHPYADALQTDVRRIFLGDEK